MKLNRPGIYHIYTDSFELLANVVGEAPVLRIPRALVMNDVIQRGQFRVVEEDSYEIQTVLHNPDLCIFKEFEYSDMCKLPPYKKSVRGSKKPDITDDQLCFRGLSPLAFSSFRA